jgi:hypothetical protein
MLSCPICFVLPDVQMEFVGVPPCFSWDSFYDLMLTLWLYVGLRVCYVLFSCSVLMCSMCCPHE